MEDDESEGLETTERWKAQYLPGGTPEALGALKTPKGPTYFDRSLKKEGCVSDWRWKLMIPEALVLTCIRTKFNRSPPQIPDDPYHYNDTW